MGQSRCTTLQEGSTTHPKSSKTPFCTQEFDFDYATFQRYLRLAWRPHDLWGGLYLVLWDGPFAAFFSFLSISCLAPLPQAVQSAAAGAALRAFGLASPEDWPLIPLMLLALALFVLAAWSLVGVALAGAAGVLGIRQPRWHAVWCRIGMAHCLAKLRHTETASPDAGWRPISVATAMSPRLPKTGRRKPYWKLSGFQELFQGLLGWAREPRMYDTHPWEGTMPPAPTVEELERTFHITFRAAFFEDRIEKGRGSVFAARYDDIHDIIEWRRIPNLAVIRLKGGAGELLVRTDLMEPATWQRIKKLCNA